MTIVPPWVTEGITDALNPPPRFEIVATRYPLTYAYDFIRSHPSSFGIPPGTPDMSRSETSAWLSKALGMDADSRHRTESQTFLRNLVCEKLADAYIEEWNLVWRVSRENVDD